jgi:SNF2 family DNA or RNA helicase
MLAEDRTHKLGQKNSINIYIFCAKVIILSWSYNM